MDIVKRAYLHTINNTPEGISIQDFRWKVREELVRLVRDRVYSPRDWPREFGRLPDELRGKRLMTEAGKCPKINQCSKVEMILDKDLAGDWQYAEAIRAVCSKCPGPDGKQ